jgi:beta-glucanase (GH16 family)
MPGVTLPNDARPRLALAAALCALLSFGCSGQIEVGRIDSGESINTGNGEGDDDSSEDEAESGDGDGQQADDNDDGGDDGVVDPDDDEDVSSDDGSDDGDGAQPVDRPGWRLTWQDEFDSAAGSAPESSRWRHDVGGGGFGNGQLEFNTEGNRNAVHDGQGNLVITARQENFQGNEYTSARITTNGTFSQAYGRFEARMRLPSGQGIWPAFWMLGTDIGDVGWPQCGEIDIMENIGRERARMYGTLHGPGYSGGESIGATYDLPSGQTFDAGFHTFAVEWEENVVRWYVDDNLYQTRTPPDVPGEWVYDHEFFIILNLAIGGNFPGYPDGTATFPQTLVVDYVRVYERE